MPPRVWNFGSVFLIGLDDGLLPHQRSFDDREAMAEERRLFYVGITRTQDYLFLVRAFRRHSFGTGGVCEPSRFLSDVPADSARRRRAAPRPHAGPGDVRAPDSLGIIGETSRPSPASAPACTFSIPPSATGSSWTPASTARTRRSPSPSAARGQAPVGVAGPTGGPRWLTAAGLEHEPSAHRRCRLYRIDRRGGARSAPGTV